MFSLIIVVFILFLAVRLIPPALYFLFLAPLGRRGQWRAAADKTSHVHSKNDTGWSSGCADQHLSESGAPVLPSLLLFLFNWALALVSPRLTLALCDLTSLVLTRNLPILKPQADTWYRAFQSMLPGNVVRPLKALNLKLELHENVFI